MTIYRKSKARKFSSEMKMGKVMVHTREVPSPTMYESGTALHCLTFRQHIASRTQHTMAGGIHKSTREGVLPSTTSLKYKIISGSLKHMHALLKILTILTWVSNDFNCRDFKHKCFCLRLLLTKACLLIFLL